MKSTGMIRKIDELGRIVLPIELRRTLGINTGDPIEIYVEGEKIILIKNKAVCVLCSSKEDLQIFKGKNICKECKKSLEK